MHSVTYAVAPAIVVYPSWRTTRPAFLLDLASNEDPFEIRDLRLLFALRELPAIFTENQAKEAFLCDRDVANVANEIWEFLVHNSLVIPFSNTSLSRLLLWRKYHWTIAFLFHEGTRDHPFVDMTRRAGPLEDQERMQGYRMTNAQPPLFMEHDAVATHRLARLSDASSKPDVETASVRLGYFLDVSFGLREQHETYILKAVPSGGARHPLEVYVFLLDSSIYAAGVYHYNVRSHSLDLLHNGDFGKLISSVSYDFLDQGDPFAVALLSAHVERSMWRYRDARSARAIYIDCGHALSLATTVARECGFATASTSNFSEDPLAATIGLNLTFDVPMALLSLSNGLN